MLTNNDQTKKSLDYLTKGCNDISAISDFSLAGEYLIWLAKQIKENQENPLYRNTYKPIIEANRTDKKTVFASVIMRTQGKRPEALREALLCLYAQSDRDFEVLLIGHKLNYEQKSIIEKILEELDPEFRDRILFISLDYGTRTTPINYGFSMASGEYVIIFDDDDLLLENWMHNFHDAAKKAPGTLLHQYAFAQKWKAIHDNGQTALCAIGAPDAKYCVKFNMITQLSLNLCPLMTIAFPKSMFHELGFIYDEKLTTTEDWDYIMRMAFVCGVTDIEDAGAIYRLWENIENSSTIHTHDEWAKNWNIIRKKYEQTPIIFRKGSVCALENHFHDQNKAKDIIRIMDDKLYYGNDNNWSEERSITLETPCSIGSFEMVYKGLAGKHSHSQLRWDPVSYGDLIIRNLGAMITDAKGGTYCFSPKDIHSTGEIYHDGILFLKDDPQIYFNIPKDFKVEKLTVWGQSSLMMPISENRKALKIFLFIKKILRKLRIIQ